MIALLLALQTAASPAAPAPTPAPAAAPFPLLAPIGKQALPASGCAAFLWSLAGDRALVAMVVAEPPRIRLAIDGTAPADLALSSGEGTASFGFAPTGVYTAGDVTVTLAMTVPARSDLPSGAVVPQSTLTVERPGKDILVLPVAGMIGCGGSGEGRN